MTEQELYCLAGLLEGEGSFMAGPPSAPNSVRIALSMTDEDVVARAANLLDVGYNEVARIRNEQMGWKKSFYVHLRGKRAVDLMEQLLPLMGMRRQVQIRKALDSYDPNLKSKLSKVQIAEIKIKLSEGITHGEIARQYGVERSTISHIKAGKRAAYR